MARAGRRRVAAVATTAAAAACAVATLLPGAALGAATTSGTVAFESNRAGNFDIFTMTATGGDQAGSRSSAGSRSPAAAAARPTSG